MQLVEDAVFVYSDFVNLLTAGEEGRSLQGLNSREIVRSLGTIVRRESRGRHPFWVGDIELLARMSNRKPEMTRARYRRAGRRLTDF